MRCVPVTAQGPFAREALPSVITTMGPCAGPVASLFLRPSVCVRESLSLRPTTTGPQDRPSFDVCSIQDCRAPYAEGPLGALTVSSRATAAFTERVAARHPLAIPQHGFVRGKFSTLQAFLNVATLLFACPSDRSHGTSRGKDFVVRAFMETVTAPHAGPATRLNRSIVATDLSSARTDMLLAAHSHPLPLAVFAAHY